MRFLDADRLGSFRLSTLPELLDLGFPYDPIQVIRERDLASAVVGIREEQRHSTDGATVPTVTF